MLPIEQVKDQGQRGSVQRRGDRLSGFWSISSGRQTCFQLSVDITDLLDRADDYDLNH